MCVCIIITYAEALKDVGSFPFVGSLGGVSSLPFRGSLGGIGRLPFGDFWVA